MVKLEEVWGALHKAVESLHLQKVSQIFEFESVSDNLLKDLIVGITLY